MEKKNRIYNIIMLVVVCVAITAVITSFCTYKYLSENGGVMYAEKNSSLEGLEETLQNFRAAFEKEYIGEIDDEAMVESAIKGYVSGLGDEYTTYYTKEEMEDLMEETEGNYVGIGIYISAYKESNEIVIIKPMEGSPAEEAGLLPGDIITKVDGVEYNGDTIDEMTNKIKGPEGTKVKVEIKRNGQTQEIEVERRKILISHIDSKIIEDNIGYISISDFEGGCAQEFEENYKNLEEQGIESLIIDIRNNGGGLVDEAIAILELITDKGSTLLITTDKNEAEEVTKSEKDPIINMPIVLLVNEYSASASEIMAGALKDNNKATLVGTTTYGKGVIQKVYPLTDGSGLKMTTNEYFTPNHNKINKIGIDPDEEIDLPEEVKYKTDITEEEDTQLQKAIEILKSENN